MKKSLLAFLVGFSVTSQVFADDLYQVYQQALQSDPATLQSLARKDAAFSDINRSRSGLLPQLSLILAASETYGDVERSSNDATLNLQQSIYDRSVWVGFDRAELIATQSDATYSLARQDLILRTVTSYFNILQAKDDLKFAQSEKRAIERQLEQTKQRFEVGLTAITDVHEAQAQFDTSVAAEISAQNAVEISLEALREITGNYHQNVSVLDTDKFSASLPAPANVTEWLSIADQKNVRLLASQLGVDIAKFDIDGFEADHYPTVTLNASANSNDTTGTSSDPANVANSDRYNTYGLRLSVNVPLYSGGNTSAAVESAKYRFVASSEERERIHRSVVRDVRSNFYDVTAAISRIKAFEQAVVSAESALKATEAGFDVGTRTIVDVLNSTRNLFDARRNLSRVRYGYVTSTLALKLAAGTLSEQDVLDINQGLEASM